MAVYNALLHHLMNICCKDQREVYTMYTFLNEILFDHLLSVGGYSYRVRVFVNKAQYIIKPNLFMTTFLPDPIYI